MAGYFEGHLPFAAAIINKRMAKIDLAPFLNIEDLHVKTLFRANVAALQRRCGGAASVRTIWACARFAARWSSTV
jgi:hypothetical protein